MFFLPGKKSHIQPGGEPLQIYIVEAKSGTQVILTIEVFTESDGATVDGSEIRRENQLILVKYPIGYRVLYLSQVVVWDFFHQQYYYLDYTIYVLYIFTNYQELQSNTETCTPLKTSIEPENGPWEKENHLPTISFWISLWGCVHVSSKNLKTYTPKN